MTSCRLRPTLRNTLALLALGLATASPLVAQTSGTTFGIGVGAITPYPEEFQGGGCDGRYGGVHLGVRRSLSQRVAIEGSVAWTGSLATSCSLEVESLSSVPMLDGSTYRLTSLAPEIPGETFWATRLGAVATPWAARSVGPFVRLSGGRLWSKKLWTWTAGGGLRYGFRNQALVLEAERWALAYDLTRETWIFRDTGMHERQGTEIIRRRPRPWFVRLGWELTVGSQRLKR